MHFSLVSETRTTVLIDHEAKLRRKSGEDPNVYGPNELKENWFNIKEVLRIWRHPFEIFIREPIVLSLSILSSILDALIFVFTESFTLVFKQWGFNTVQCGLTFITIFIGYLLTYAIFLPDLARQLYVRSKDGDVSRIPERRILFLLFLAPLEKIGFYGFAWTSMDPEYTP